MPGTALTLLVAALILLILVFIRRDPKHIPFLSTAAAVLLALSVIGLAVYEILLEVG